MKPTQVIVFRDGAEAKGPPPPAELAFNRWMEENHEKIEIIALKFAAIKYDLEPQIISVAIAVFYRLK